MVLDIDETWCGNRLFRSGRREGVRDRTSHHHPPTRPVGADRGGDARLPVTDRVSGRLLSLPLFPAMTGGQIDRVCEELARALTV